ncbi:MAG TPA: hypothetical protein VMV92_26745 [Streptosporangiaceae bacterium]|nr:hypothetical protein [Streptosporangiaceae bacterium]
MRPPPAACSPLSDTPDEKPGVTRSPDSSHQNLEVMTGHDERRLPPLPFRPRPGRGETADDYIRRLAAANHLRYSSLRRYLGARSYGACRPRQTLSQSGIHAGSRIGTCHLS